MKRVFKYVKTKFVSKPEIFLLCLILLVAAGLRFYRLDEYMTFRGDEGRDAIIIKQMLVDKNFPYIGPPSSVGTINLGPLYYYMMAVAMTIFWLNPVAASGMVAIIGLATILLIYYPTKQWFGKTAGLVAAALFAFSPINIFASKSSWNPYPAPFFALLGILGMYRAYQTSNFRWLILTGFATAASMQMHNLAMILIAVFGVMWSFELVRILRKKSKGSKHFWQGSIMAVLIFIATILPLILFELKHNFRNFNGLKELFTSGDKIGFNLSNFTDKLTTLYSYNLVGRYLAVDGTFWNVLLSILVLSSLGIYTYFNIKKNFISWPFWALLVWLWVGLIAMAFYSGPVYDHYLGFLSPIPFILLGSLFFWIGKIPSKKAKTAILVVLASMVCVIFYYDLIKSPLIYQPNRQLQRTQEISKFIIDKSEHRPYNFALIAKNNYDSAYQYYLDIFGFPPQLLEQKVTDQLFVVCEDIPCQPYNNPKYEVAAFGMSRIEDEYDLDGLKIYKLVANPTGVSPE